MTRTEIRLAGFGGQGIVLMGRILAQAAVHDKKETTQEESYGMETRGGRCKSDVIISDELIDYPEVINADIMVVMSQESLNFVNLLKDDGTLIIDPFHIKNLEGVKKKRIYKVAATEIANSQFRKPIVANMIMLGALIGLTNVLPEESVRQAMDIVPKGTKEDNMKAFEKGLKIGIELRSSVS